MKQENVMQFTFKNGIHAVIGVASFEEYQKFRQKILKSRKRFVEVIPTLTIDKKEVVLIEFFVNQIKEETEDGKD